MSLPKPQPMNDYHLWNLVEQLSSALEDLMARGNYEAWLCRLFFRLAVLFP